jgi:hypothetical protein
MKSVVDKLKELGKSEDEIAEFRTGAQGFAKKIIANFQNWEFYTGESMNPDGMCVALPPRVTDPFVESTRLTPTTGLCSWTIARTALHRISLPGSTG